MVYYCDKCKSICEYENCPYCQKKKIREVREDDLCFLIEVKEIWQRTIEDILETKRIPYMSEKVMGAGLALYVGPNFERSRFFVPYKFFDTAQEIMKEAYREKDEEGVLQGKTE